MRLLNTLTLKLSEFYEDNTPQYTILSHTWDGCEITLQEWEAGIKADSPGHTKVLTFSRYAAQHGYEWCWVDTICIDKKSSVDLSEAINSMFDWYREANTCIVYLSDVKTGSNREETLCNFEASRWFRRGWTLQELLAPDRATFLDRNWELIGEKADMIESLVAVTAIPMSYLTDGYFVKNASVAQRMSWASRRQTARIEDMAYCLMGIFEISMPLLYGERHNAFRRLQEEIIKVSEDESIFVWDGAKNGEYVICGCLAPDPACFRDCSSILNAREKEQDLRTSGKPAYSMLKRQLKLIACVPDPHESWLTTEPSAPQRGETIAVALNCYQEDGPEETYCGMMLKYDGYEWWKKWDWSSPQRAISVPRDLKSKMCRRQIWLRAY